jgi:hypothetical protein
MIHAAFCWCLQLQLAACVVLADNHQTLICIVGLNYAGQENREPLNFATNRKHFCITKSPANAIIIMESSIYYFPSNEASLQSSYDSDLSTRGRKEIRIWQLSSCSANIH